MMFTKEFSYDLPKELIAKKPVSPRDSSRLMVLHRDSGQIEHRNFSELPEILTNEYVLVLNKTRVFPARLKIIVDGYEGELLLIKETRVSIWKCMVKPGKKFSVDKGLVVAGKKENLDAEVVGVFEDGTREIKFNVKDLARWVEDNGYPPFPPYIKDSPASLNDYQTVYAKETGSIAAPTAGLHFTDKVFKELENKGIEKQFVTLHVGRGTFLPVKTEKIDEHKMHSEWYELDEACTNNLNMSKVEGKRILAVGTTSVRVLESNFKDGKFHPEAAETDIFIYPGYKFKAVDALLTNFHLPESTLIMLVCAFAGKELVFKAYQEAIREKYRFYSFGDAMLVI